MPTSNALPLCLRGLPTGWRFHLLMLLATTLTVVLALMLRDLLISLNLSAHYVFWCVTPVTMTLFLIWGQRAFWGVLLGEFIALLLWFPWHLALVGALDGALQISFGIWIFRRFWPSSQPLRPSVRFFALLIGLGVITPVALFTLPVAWAFSKEAHFMTIFDNIYLGWCINEVSGVLILLPPILMALYPAFRRTIERPKELAIYISLGIVLMVWGVSQSLEVNKHQIMMLESWMLVGTTGFVMVLRNGVGGIIIANIAMAAATFVVQIVLVNSTPWLTPRMLLEFNLYTCHLTGLTLILAAGFHDYKLLSDISRNTAISVLETQMKERNRIAADLHDSVSQEFAAALMYLRSCTEETPFKTQKDAIERVESCLVKGIKELRGAAIGLRPELLEHGNFADILDAYCATFEVRHAVDVLFESGIAEHALPLSLNKKEHLFRIVQESLNNAVHHGKAQTISVHLLTNAKHTKIILQVADDGIGFDMAAGIDMSDRPHLGLRLMQERTLMIDGTLSINSAPGKGTVIEVRVPIAETA